MQGCERECERRIDLEEEAPTHKSVTSFRKTVFLDGSYKGIRTLYIIMNSSVGA